MSKKHQSPRFRDTWVNQTELGRHFGISAVAVGKKLTECGLRNEQKEPSELAHKEEYCHFAPMRDGTPFFLWHKEKVAELFCQAGMRQLSKQEVEARSTAIGLISLTKEAEETGIDKFLTFFVGEIPLHEHPLIDHFLRELGSDMRLGDEYTALQRCTESLSHQSDQENPRVHDTRLGSTFPNTAVERKRVAHQEDASKQAGE